MRVRSVVRSFLSAVFSAALLWLPLAAESAEPPADQGSLRGSLTMVWGDPAAGSGAPPEHRFLFTPDAGETRELDFSQWVVNVLGGFGRLDTVPVELTLGRSGRSIDSVRPAPQHRPRRSRTSAASAVSGSMPWITLPCKFSDVDEEPEDLSYFLAMYDDAFPGLDHYWRELSYDDIDLLGSTSVDWVTLPHPRSQYVVNNDADLTALFQDCTAAHDAQVDFSRGGGEGYVGINLAFNASLDCCAWGGSFFTELDGVRKSWRTAWLPPWAYQTVSVVAHEMGHGFGLPHSNNSDEDGWPYDNPWDVMSADRTPYTLDDAVFGGLGQHTISHHKDRLGWLLSEEIFQVHRNGTDTVTLDHLAKPAAANHRLVWIRNRGDGTFYTVEARDLAGYDGVPDKAVIIHHVSLGRRERAWIVDADDPPASYSDTEGVMWRVGETFSPPGRGVEVRVDTETADGFQVTIDNAQEGPLYAEDFESGDGTFFTSGYWHLTSACESSAAGHSTPTTLYYGVDSRCDYGGGGRGAGWARFHPLRLDGIAPPIELRFNYFLETAPDNDVAALYISQDGGAFERVASNLGFDGEILLEDPSGTWRSLTIDLSERAGSEIRLAFYLSHDDVLNDYAGFYVDDVVVDACFAADDLVLESVTVGTSELYEACSSISAGNGFHVDPAGEVTFRAPGRIVLRDGFSVASGGRFAAEIAPPQAD